MARHVVADLREPARLPARRLRPDRADRFLEPRDRGDPRSRTPSTSPSTSRTCSSTSARRPSTARVDDPNAGFSFHNYCLGAAPGLPAIPDPIGACENVGETLVFENAEAHARATGAALIMTEFGDTADPAIHERVAGLADRYMVSWTDWAYMGSTGQIKLDDAKPPRPGNLRADRLDSVSRAYPRLISGTPERFSYDEGTPRFELVYSPGRFRPGSLTEVWVPRADFPDGYSITVSGAEVRSKPNAQRLLLALCPGAERVELVVAPGRAARAAARGACGS